MSSPFSTRINARTIVLDAARQNGAAAASAEEPRLCAHANCCNLVAEVWEETGTLCARCAIEEDLFDREERRRRSFSLPVF